MRNAILLALTCVATVIIAQDTRAQSFESAVSFGGEGETDIGLPVYDSNGNVYFSGRFHGTVDVDPGPDTNILTSVNVQGGSLTDAFLVKLDPNQDFVWVAHLSANGDPPLASIVSRTVDPSGNVYSTGLFHGTTDFDPGPGTFNLTAAGSGSWIYDGFVWKLDSGGNFVWAIQFTGTPESPHLGTVVVTAENELWISGLFYNTVDFDPGPGVFDLVPVNIPENFLLKLDTDGNFISAEIAPPTPPTNTLPFDAVDEAQDSYGNSILVGHFEGTVDFDPGPGTFELTAGHNTPDVFILKLDSDGNFAWVGQLVAGPPGPFEPQPLTVQRVVTASTDDIVVLGVYRDTLVDLDPGPEQYNVRAPTNYIEGFLIKVDSGGSLMWARVLEGSGDVEPRFVYGDSDDRFYTLGTFRFTVDFDPGPGVFELTATGDGYEDENFFFWKLDSAGDFLWAGHYGSDTWQSEPHYWMDDDENFYTKGSFRGIADFDPGPGMFTVTSGASIPGERDAFLCKFSKDPDDDRDGHTVGLGDCNDADGTVYPGAPQICDGINNDCLDAAWPSVPASEIDDDGDLFAECQGDCADADPLINPGAPEVCNAIDDNCNNLIDDDASGEDTDGDSVHNACDNCRDVINPTQIDTDEDGFGNSCDNCTFVVNPDQLDADGDLRGNACDNCPLDYNTIQDDFDSDGVGDACDNCILQPNITQGDLDDDYEGDLCDLDDGVIYILFHQPEWVEWQEEIGFDRWNSYRGDLQLLRDSQVYTQDPLTVELAERTCGTTDPWAADADPAPGQAVFFLTTGIYSGTSTESGLGLDSDGLERLNANPCP